MKIPTNKNQFTPSLYINKTVTSTIYHKSKPSVNLNNQPLTKWTITIHSKYTRFRTKH